MWIRTAGAAITLALALTLTVPMTGAAQAIGFQVGIAPGVPNRGVQYAVPNNPYARPQAPRAYATNPYTPYGPPQSGFVGVPGFSTGVIVGWTIGYTNWPYGLVGVPNHPVQAPVIPRSVPTARDRLRQFNTSDYRGHTNVPQPAPVPATPVFIPGRGASVPGASRPNASFPDDSSVIGRTDIRNGNGIRVIGNDARTASAGPVAIGSTRASVIEQYGAPTVTMVSSVGEALVFGGTTVLIQNGVVTRIDGR
jgi:hypothetical protein